MPKVKVGTQNPENINKLKRELIYGDYTSLGEIMGISPDAAKKRFLRGNVEAINFLQKIVDSRKQLKKEFNQN